MKDALTRFQQEERRRSAGWRWIGGAVDPSISSSLLRAFDPSLASLRQKKGQELVASLNNKVRATCVSIVVCLTLPLLPLLDPPLCTCHLLAPTAATTGGALFAFHTHARTVMAFAATRCDDNVEAVYDSMIKHNSKIRLLLPPSANLTQQPPRMIIATPLFVFLPRR